MTSPSPLLASLLKSLPPPPVTQEVIREHVKVAVEKTSHVQLPVEVRKSRWENALKSEVFKLAKTGGQALRKNDTKYYDELKTLLDVALEFALLDACDSISLFVLLQDLLETQTIASCSHIFSWIELRAPQLTADMVPQKGKALVLLRTLNDLLRRLSKMGSNTMFCGRILTFLSGVFPLGERSGVNLRGEYGPTWEGVQGSMKPEKSEPEEKVAVDKAMETDSVKAKQDTKPVEEDNKMEVDSAEASKAVDTKPDGDNFYNIFWSLQLPFSKPPVFAASTTFATFQDSVNKVLPVIKEHTTKERVMMGSRASGSGTSNPLKRKRDDEPVQVTEYFFAKFLTSPDLLGLELKDTHFRRQFLLQLLIVLNHLLTFTKTSKDAWLTTRNRSLNMEFTLESDDAQWVQDTIVKAMEEIKQTAPNGRAFADTVHVILERERNWVKWKNENCPPFDKEPWSAGVDGKQVGLYEATKPLFDKMRVTPAPWQWMYGSKNLTEVWQMGYRDLQDLENFSAPEDVKGYWTAINKVNTLIEYRKTQLQKTAELRAASLKAKAEADAPPAAAAAAATTTEDVPKDGAKAAAEPGPIDISALAKSDPSIAKHEETKQRLSWLTLRAARDQHLSLFGKIGTGDIELLMKGIDGPNEGGAAPSSPLVTPSISKDAELVKDISSGSDHSKIEDGEDVKMAAT